MTRKRIGTLLLCVGLILALSVSVVFIAHEADHDCCGEDCPVCQAIAASVRLLKALTLAVSILLLFSLLLSGPAARRRQDTAVFFRPGTLVSWKIRLDD